jgi:hypothetical protein
MPRPAATVFDRHPYVRALRGEILRLQGLLTEIQAERDPRKPTLAILPPELEDTGNETYTAAPLPEATPVEPTLYRRGNRWVIR